MKVLTVFGTRPEAIKMAPVIKELKACADIECITCVTGQHRQMLDQVLDLFRIEREYDLNIMEEDQDIFAVTAKSLPLLNRVIKSVDPQIVLVQGDTSTAFASSLAAFYLKKRIAHIEAGLRTEDKFNPFPEEMNRRLIDELSDLHFASTEWAKSNLLEEGVRGQGIFVTGNTVIDALLMIVDRYSNTDKSFERKFWAKYGIHFDERPIILVTGHRRESFGKDFEGICHGLKIIAQKEDVNIIYPVHLNPNVQKPIYALLKSVEQVHLVEPLDYETFVWLMNKSYLILTDSGGIQEEAPTLGKPVLVMRKTTERPEGINAGVAKLVGTNSQKIFKESHKLLSDKREYERMAKAANPYGDGKAARRIVEIIRNYL